MADSSIQLHDTTSEITGGEARVLTQTTTDPEGGGSAHIPYVLLAAGSVGRTTAGGAAPGQSIKSFSSSGGVSINSGATANVYTVTAGKTFFITDILISVDSNTAILVQIKAGSLVIFEKYVSTTADADLTGIESQPSVGAGVALTVVFPVAAGKNGTYFISGFEQ